MSKRLMDNKLSIVWYALSSVVIIAGIILFALFGFNRSVDYPQSQSIEVSYDIYVTQYEKDGELQTLCEDALKANGINSWTKKVYEVSAGGIVEYVVQNADGTQMTAVKTQIESKIAEKISSGAWSQAPQTFVEYHTLTLQDAYEAQWRGGIAVAVAAIVVLAYLAVRCGIASAVVGLIGGAHDFLFTLALVALARIPVIGYMPILLGAIAVFLSITYHTLVAVRMRSMKKQQADASAEQLVGTSVCASSKAVLIVSGALAVFCALVGLLVQGTVMAFLLPAIVPVAVAAYSTLLFMPALHAVVKGKIDRAMVKRGRYAHAKKAAPEQNND